MSSILLRITAPTLLSTDVNATRSKTLQYQKIIFAFSCEIYEISQASIVILYI